MTARHESGKRGPATISPDRSAGWLRRAMPIVLRHNGYFFTAIICAFVALVAQVQIPWVMGQAIDHTVMDSSSTLSRYVTILVVLAAVRWMLNIVSRVLLLRTAYRIEYDFRTLIYAHLMAMSFPFFDRVTSGEIMSRANSDIRAIQMYLAQAPIILAQCAVALIVFVQMVQVSFWLALVAMMTLPFVGVFGVQMRRRLFPVSWLVQARLAGVTGVVDENINGVRVVKSFAAEQDELRKLAKAAVRAEWAVVQDVDIRARWSPLLENLPRLGQALILLYGGWMAFDGQISVGTLVTFNAYVLLLQPPFRMLGLMMMMSQRAAASADRIYALLDERSDIVDPPDALAATGPSSIRFDHVTFGYDAATPILRDFDLAIEEGESVALVGRSGSGKSTVVRLLLRFYDVDHGAVSIGRHDVRELSMESVRSQVGAVLDEPFLFSVSIRDNIAYSRPEAPFDQVIAAAKAANAHEFIERLPMGYDTVVGERGYTLSGGQRQRIAIARMLLLDPPIAVFDDATSAIDVHVEAEIHRGMQQMARDRTTVIIGHRLSTIKLADRVALIDDGRVMATGTHDELLATVPQYRAILAEVEADAQAKAPDPDGDPSASAEDELIGASE